MSMSEARQRADAGDEYLTSLESMELFAEIRNARGNIRKLNAAEVKVNRMIPYIFPEGRPMMGEAVSLVNYLGEVKELTTGEPYEPIVDESDEFTSLPHLEKTSEQIYKRMEKWCDNGYFESRKKLAKFFSYILQEMDRDDHRMFVKDVSNALFEFQRRDSDPNHVPRLTFRRVAIDSCGDRIFEVDDNCDVVLIPEAHGAMVDFITSAR